MLIFFKQFIFVLTCFLALVGYSQTATPSIENADSTGIFHFKQKWKYSYRDNLKNTLVENDILWTDSVNVALDEDEVKRINFKGYIWLRLAFFVPNNFKEDIIALEVSQQGASQFFINNQFVKQYGLVSKNGAEEIKHNGNNEPIFFAPIKGKVNVVVVRYSQHALPKYVLKENTSFNFNISFKTQYEFVNSIKNDNIIQIISVSIAIFLFTLAFVHFILFLFYRSKKSNLYQVFFATILGLMFLSVFIIQMTSSIILNQIIEMYSVTCLLLLFISLLVLLGTIFQIKQRRLLFVLFSLYLIAIITSFIQFDYTLINGLAFWGVIIVSLIASLRHIYYAVKNNLQGAAIIGVGFGVFIMFCSFSILSVVILFISSKNGNVGITYGSSSFFIVLTLLSVLSVPITMSVYLAYDFANTNKSLSQKLMEVETLSQLSIKQEQEKQQILTKQNEVLEEQVTQRTKEIREQKVEIEEKHKEITDSINYAKRIQQAVLTGEDVWSKISPEHFILFKPKDIVSGDFYWAYNTPNGRSIFALADCTGHGVPGGFMSMLGNSFLNEIVVENKIFKADEILNKLRTKIIAALEQKGQTQQKDGMDISLCVWNKIDNTLEFAGANNPLWLLRNNEITEYKANKMPIGTYLEEEQPFTSTIIQLNKGDIIYLSTDGYADQFGGPKGKKFKYKPLIEMIITNHLLPLQEQELVLETIFNEWKHTMEQVDDVSIIGIKVMS